MAWKRFTLTVELLEDLHTGTGAGYAAIDAAQAQDRTGQPVLRSTHLKGVWREAARALPGHGDVAERLFGSDSNGQRGRVALTSFYLHPEDVARPWRQIWSSTRRHERNRAPMPDTLRTVEYVRAGTRFVGEVRLQEDGDKPSIEDLWRECLRHSPALGGHRSRGDGQVAWKLGHSVQNASKSAKPPAGNSLRLRLLLKNLDPLCLALTGNPGNIIPSEGYIRGQRLLGALAEWALRNGHSADLLFQHRVSVGNAWPLPEQISPTSDLAQCDVAPMPLHLGAQKSQPPGKSQAASNSVWPWWARKSNPVALLGEAGEQDRFHSQDKQLKRPKGYEFLFRSNPGTPWCRYQPTLGIHMRNRVRRRPTETGELFSEQELAENTQFLVDLHFADPRAAQQFANDFAALLQTANQEWLTLGRGGRPVGIVAVCWMSPPTGKPAVSSDQFTLTLESDLIARSPDNLGFYNRFDPAMLWKLLDQEPPPEMKGWKYQVFSEAETVRGFNAASGLQRPPALAIQRGSAIHIQGTGVGKLRTALGARLTSGLGERTWEGFGRFRLDFDPLRDAATPLSPAAGAAFQENRDETLFSQAQALANRIKSGPSRNQWQYLRRRALSARSWADIRELFRELEESQAKLGGLDWKELPKGADLAAIRATVEAIARKPANPVSPVSSPPKQTGSGITSQVTVVRKNSTPAADLPEDHYDHLQAARFFDALARYRLLELPREAQ